MHIQYTVFLKRSYFKETFRGRKKKDFLAANSQICHLVAENQHLNYQLLHLLSSKRTSFEYALFDLTCKKTFLHCCTAPPLEWPRLWRITDLSLVVTHWLYRNFYARKMRAQYWNHFWYQMSNRHLWQLKFWSYQLNSTANPAHLPHKVGQMGWIGSAV